MSERKKIRNDIVARIKTASTASGLRVFSNRINQIFPQELPCVLVYARDESATVFDQSPLLYQRKLRIGIEIAAAAVTALDDFLDEQAELVEQAMIKDHKLGGLVEDILLTETDLTFSNEGEKPIGVCRLTYEVTYYTSGANNPSSLPSIGKIHNQIELADDTALAEQTILLP